jgi:uncharacterized Tic20 family protein
MTDSLSDDGQDPGRDARIWGMACHLAGAAGFALPLLGFVLGPLVVWILTREVSPFVDSQGKEAMNFQLTMLLAFFVAGLLIFIVIGIPLMIALTIFEIVMIIVAGVRAYEGKPYRYPVAIRFLK